MHFARYCVVVVVLNFHEKTCGLCNNCLYFVDDRTELNEADRQLVADSMFETTELSQEPNSAPEPPAKKRQKSNGAKVLGISDFPSCSKQAQLETPLELFTSDNNAGDISPHASTPISTRAAPLEFVTPAAAANVNTQNVSMEEMRQFVHSALHDRSMRDEDKHEHRYQRLSRRCNEYETRLLACEKIINDNTKEITELKAELKTAQQDNAELRATLAQQINRPGALKVRPDLSDISLTPFDVESTHEYDSNVPKQVVSPEKINKIRAFSKTRRIFIANIARQMFSMEERVRESNIAGAKNRPSLSPAKSRFQTICYYTSQQYNCAMDAALQSDVRKTIDETNRRFRDDLKIRKYKRTAAAGAIVPMNNDDD